MKSYEITEEQRNKVILYIQEIPTKWGIELLKFFQYLPEIKKEEVEIKEEK